MFKTALNSLLTAALLLSTAASSAEELPGLAGMRRVVFLGDSITYSGQYIETVEAYLAVRYPEQRVELLNLGLPSETVSGLSEPGHADGKFPRPDVHERLARVLEQTQPDLLVACYGMNCGMYYPPGEERMAKFREGIERLRAAAAKQGAKVLHVTPPVFDPLPIQARTLPAGREEYKQPYQGYNEVLDQYSAWLVAQRDRGWQVVDLHTAINRYLAEQRKSNPQFTLAGDGVHMNETGHWLAAQQLLLHLGAPPDEIEKATSSQALLASYPRGGETLNLVQQKQRLLKDAWLTKVGHERPGMKAGLPLADAQRAALELESEIRGSVKED